MELSEGSSISRERERERERESRWWFIWGERSQMRVYFPTRRNSSGLFNACNVVAWIKEAFWREGQPFVFARSTFRALFSLVTPPCSAERIHEGKNEGSTALSSLLLLFFFFFLFFFCCGIETALWKSREWPWFKRSWKLFARFLCFRIFCDFGQMSFYGSLRKLWDSGIFNFRHASLLFSDVCILGI